MNNRLKTIECSVSKIPSFEKELSVLKVHISNANENHDQITKKLTEFDTSIKYVCELSDDLYSSRGKVESEIAQLRFHNKSLTEQVQVLTKQNKDLHQMCIDTQCKTQANDLIFFGIPEARRGPQQNHAQSPPENLENTLRQFLKDHLQSNADIQNEFPIDADALSFNKVHRIGNPTIAAQNNRARPVVATFERLRDREQVKKAGAILNKTQRQVKVHEFFPKEVEERRKKLYPIMRRYQQCGERVSLVRDKLFVNNYLYDLDTNAFVRNQTTGSYAYPQYAQTRPHREHEPGAYQPRPVRESEHSDPLLPRAPTQTQRPAKPPSYRELVTNAHTQLNFETPNRFASLAVIDKSTLKRKERSPLDPHLEVQTKRIDVTDSPTSQEESARLVQCENMLIDPQTLSDPDSMTNPWSDVGDQASSHADPDGPPTSSDRVTNK